MPRASNITMTSRTTSTNCFSIAGSCFYSCADFHSPTDTIEQAQLNKANHILSLLDPKPGEKIIELGCGWGSMLRHIQASIGDSANLYGITLSRDQVSYIRDKFGFNILLNDFVSVDYGVETYDKIYSIGSLEHVRPDDILPLYKKLHAALKLGGRAILHFFSLNGIDPVPTSSAWRTGFFSRFHSVTAFGSSGARERGGLYADAQFRARLSANFAHLV